MTSQWTYLQCVWPIDSLREWPSSSSMSAMTSLAPWLAKTLAVLSPIPLAPPVMRATLPSSLFYVEEAKLLFVFCCLSRTPPPALLFCSVQFVLCNCCKCYFCVFKTNSLWPWWRFVISEIIGKRPN